MRVDTKYNMSDMVRFLLDGNPENSRDPKNIAIGEVVKIKIETYKNSSGYGIGIFYMVRYPHTLKNGETRRIDHEIAEKYLL
jgi:hypothetical protein